MLIVVTLRGNQACELGKTVLNGKFGELKVVLMDKDTSTPEVVVANQKGDREFCIAVAVRLPMRTLRGPAGKTRYAGLIVDGLPGADEQRAVRLVERWLKRVARIANRQEAVQLN